MDEKKLIETRDKIARAKKNLEAIKQHPERSALSRVNRFQQLKKEIATAEADLLSETNPLGGAIAQRMADSMPDGSATPYEQEHAKAETLHDALAEYYGETKEPGAK